MENNLNYNDEKNNKTTNVLLILVLIVGVLILGLLVYKMFIYDNKENNTNKDNNIVNKDDTTEEALKKIEEKTKEINALIDNFNYNYLIDKESSTLKTSDLTKEDILYLVYGALNTGDYIEGSYMPIGDSGKDDNSPPVTDSTGKKYPNYNSDKKLVCPNTKESSDHAYAVLEGEFQKYMQMMGLTVDEIEKMDANLWNCGNSASVPFKFTIVAKDIFESKLNKLFGKINNNIFNESFFTKSNISCGTMDTIYDKNIEKAFIQVQGGCTAQYINEHLLLNVEYKNDNLILTVITGKDVTITTKDMLYENQDKYDKYEVTFKKENGNYIFDNIKIV